MGDRCVSTVEGTWREHGDLHTEAEDLPAWGTEEKIKSRSSLAPPWQPLVANQPGSKIYYGLSPLLQ